MPELVAAGENGALVAVAEAGRRGRGGAALDRRVRASVEDRFGVDRMVDDYVAVYERVISGGGG